MEERPLPLIFNRGDLVFQFGDFYEDNVEWIGDAMGILTSGDTSSRQNKKWRSIERLDAPSICK